MEKIILAKKEIEDMVQSYNNFINSLNLTDEQKELAFTFLKKLLITISKHSKPGIDAYNRMLYGLKTR